MPIEANNYVLGAIFLALSEACAMATGKPIAELASYFMNRVAQEAPPAAFETCRYLADLAADDAEVEATDAPLSPFERVLLSA
jgi:hypothetical protein